MSERRVFRWATSARLLAGTLVSIAAVVGVVAAVSLPWPTRDREPVELPVVPAPAESVVACDGGLLSIGRTATDAASVAFAAPQTVVSGVSADAPPALEQQLQSTTGDAPLAFTALPQDRERVDVAAAGAASVQADDLAGFAASACRPPLLESWLVGGSGSTGAADLVVLSNPGSVAATVDLTVYGVTGEQTPPGGEGIVLAPGTQRIVPLAGIALDEASPVVRVSAVGAPVHASLQASITRTLTPGGVDQVSPIAQPAQEQTITGVAVTQAPGTGGATDSATVVRMLSPSSDATAQVTVTAVGGSEPVSTPEQVSLTAGQPLELALPGLAVGSYTVEVSADAPVVSAVWQATGVEEGDDFAWYAPSPEVSVASLFAVPDGPSPVLTVVNPGDEAAVVAVTSEDGIYSLQLTVPAAGTATARLSSSTVYLLEPDAPVHAALSFTGDGALAGIPVWPADAASPAIAVYP